MDHDFHFAEWAFLAQADTQVFERRRRQVIAEFMLASGRRRPQLEVLQRRIDSERRAAATAEEAAVAIVKLMCRSCCSLIGEVRGLGEEVQKLSVAAEAAERREGGPAQIARSRRLQLAQLAYSRPAG